MYLTTKLSNPNYVPEISVKVTLVNFALTAAGLEDQLLALVVAHERPELEEERVTLMLQTAQNKKNLKELEDKILCTLSSSSGSILEDETAINVLSDAKRLVTETQEKQTVAEETEKKDKLLFSFLMCINLQRSEGLVDDREWLFLLTGGVAVSGKAEENPAPEWLSDSSWQHIRMLQNLPGLKEWQRFVESENPHREKVPSKEGYPPPTRLQKLCLLRVLRSDKVVAGVIDFVADLLGKTYIEPPAFDLGRTFSASNCCMPLIFLLTPGADPSSLLFKFAEENNSLKMVTEAPKGIKANLRRLYMSDPISEPNYLTGPNTDERFRRLVFAVSFFHAVVQERRLFGPLGWNIPYSFSDTDLRISVLQLKNLLAMYKDVPWEALLYLTAECNYGGKVTDQRDRRTLATLLERFYCPEVLKEENYSFDQSGGYLAPPDGDHEMFLSYIDELPRDAPPRVFGMNNNANITKDQAETTKLFSALLITQQSSLSAGGHEGDSDVDITGRTCEDILSRLPKLFDVDAALAKFPTLREQSLNTVLLQEMCRYNTLISTITSSLQSVLRALAGTVTGTESLTEKTEEVLINIRTGRVPSLWKSKSYPTLKSLGSYIIDLCQRLDYFQKWYENGIPSVFWISGFFFTQSFLTAVLQNHARKHGISIDQLWFDFLIWLKPMVRTEIPPRNSYSCPLYKTSERRGELTTTGHHTNYVISVTLPSKEPEQHWILRGVALLLSLTD
ncbi:hypothetical protein Anas_01838 [Armadillidium nasatum]|uniref:Dynein heavy chain 7, axonemal n=1 Tax=Armadillidium nasatum TaxID=96803 RepID=A0A5N5TFA3_9CRUS|nr:hypothetical protein Anas_01838 [Armadillidium nasatum]